MNLINTKTKIFILKSIFSYYKNKIENNSANIDYSRKK